MTPLCSKCGGPMPPLPDDLAAMMATNPGVTMSHDVCPGEVTEAAAGRYFEIRASVVEVTEQDDVVGMSVAEVTEMLSFKTGVYADNLDAAMRPLAEAFGEKWMEAEKRAPIADTPEEPT